MPQSHSTGLHKGFTADLGGLLFLHGLQVRLLLFGQEAGDRVVDLAVQLFRFLRDFFLLLLLVVGQLHGSVDVSLRLFALLTGSLGSLHRFLASLLLFVGQDVGLLLVQFFQLGLQFWLPFI